MFPKTRHSSLSSGSETIALPRTPANVLKVSPQQAVAGIQQLGKDLMLNRCQLKRLGAACQRVYQNSALDAKVNKLLANVHARGRIWRSAGPLESLILVPSELSGFETELSQLDTQQQTFVTIAEDERREEIAISSALEQILWNEHTWSQALALTGHLAETFVSHLQTALEKSPNLNPKVREEWIKALQKLGVEEEVLPSQLRIEGIIIPANPFAQGRFSDIYQGALEDELVAVKRPRFKTSQNCSETRKSITRELLLWRQLSPQYVLRIFGIRDPLHDIILEWMPYGTLKDFLKISMRKDNNWLQLAKDKDINRLKIVCQVASAVEYLHSQSPPIPHGDIKAENIYVNDSCRPVIGGFDRSCHIYTTDRTMSSTLDSGSVRWMAPELLSPEVNSGKFCAPSIQSDIWAFGMFALEVFTDDLPYAMEVDAIVVRLIVQKQKPPNRPDPHICERGLTNEVWSLLKACWNFTHPKNRPSATHLREQLEISFQSTKITTETERKTMLIPKHLFQRIITSNTESWKTLGVRIVEDSRIMREKGVSKVVIHLTGRAEPVATACRRIEDSIKIYGTVRVTVHIDIPKEYYSRIIGKKHCNHRKLQDEYGVQINFPSIQSQSSLVTIMGSVEAVEKTKARLRKMIGFENAMEVVQVSSQVAEKVDEQRQNICRPPLSGLKVEYHGSNAKITLQGSKDGIINAQQRIWAIEKEVYRWITEEIPLDDFHHRLIASDPQVWVDIIKRCDGPPCPESDKYPFVLDILPRSIRVRGPPNLISTLRKEVDELKKIGHSCVLAKRISVHRHKLLDDQGGLLPNLRKHARAMVYFPKSGGYKLIGKPQNLDDCGEIVDYKEIVKVVGTREECQKAMEYLKTRVKDQRERNIVCKLPAILHDTVKRKLDPMFDTLGITVESKVPTRKGSILSLVSELVNDPELGWSIHEADYKRKDVIMCEMRLISQTEAVPTTVEQRLREAVMAQCRIIGILRMRSDVRAAVIKKMEMLENDELLWEVDDQTIPSRLIIGGPSTLVVKSVILNTIPLMDEAR